MQEKIYDIIVIGAGSGGLSVGLFMNKAGFKVLMVSKSDRDIGGDCLNDGCVPSKALIHAAKIAHQAKLATRLGLNVSGNIDIEKAIAYVHERQKDIRVHENATWLREQGITVALGNAFFTDKNEIEVEGKRFHGKKIVIATGSTPKKLKVSGVELVNYYDNESIFHLQNLPETILFIGGGPIGIEMAQTLKRLGSKVTVVHNRNMILNHDDPIVSNILYSQLKEEGIEFFLYAEIDSFTSANEAVIKFEDGSYNKISFDAVFVAIGRKLNLDTLQPANAGIAVRNNKLILNKYLQTTNKNIFAVGDVAGDLQFSHAAEMHARIVLNNLFSPIKKRLNNDHMSWVTFTDPQLATFGLSEKQLRERKINYQKLEQDFNEDDRAVIDNYQYGKMILFISAKGFLKKQKVLGGTMVAPDAGEIIQELILANTAGMSINEIFNKIYPYPVASRINQKIILEYKQKGLTKGLKKILQLAFKIFI
jgi:pyruvate/2-oxoglutarate dehydrogenase complex dihydrolipoamide dehydrogenase (E3) component